MSKYYYYYDPDECWFVVCDENGQLTGFYSEKLAKDYIAHLNENDY